MGKLNVCLRGSTLLETIVASVLFLLVFAISLETTTRLTASSRDAGILIEVDYRLNECFREYSSIKYFNGEYERTYDWGNIHVDISQYGSYKQLRHISLKACIANSHKVLEFNHIVAVGDE